MRGGPVTVLSAARRAKHRAFLARRDAATVLGAMRRRHRTRALARTVAAHLDLPPLPRVQGIWAVSMVRDEAELLKRSVTHLLHQGVDAVLIVDNGSTDATPEVLAALASDPRVHAGTDRLVAYEQSVKMTHLADAATRAGATWIVPFDADELWSGTSGTLAETLRSARAPIVGADLVNLFPGTDANAGAWQLDPTSQVDTKVAFRPFPGAVIEMGNHAVLRPGRTAEGLGIVHLPWRSFEQFSRKVRQGAAALDASDAPESMGSHWRRLGALDEAGLRRAWDDITRGRVDHGTGWMPRGRSVPFTLADAGSWEAVRSARAKRSS